MRREEEDGISLLVFDDPLSTHKIASDPTRPPNWDEISSVSEYSLYNDPVAEAKQLRSEQRLITKKKLYGISQGSFLPLLVDKMRNNIRNRALLAMVYGLAAAVVAMLIILSFPFNTEGSTTLKFHTPPPQTLAIGEPVDVFSVQVLDKNSMGIAGVKLRLVLLPVKPIALIVSMSSANILSRTMDCMASLALINSTYSLDDNYFCIPGGANNMRLGGDKVETDGNGVASFNNFTVGFGQPGLFILVIASISYETPLSLTSFFTLTAEISSFKLTTIPKVRTLPIQQPYNQPLSMTATWRAYGAPPTYVCALLLAMNMQGAVAKSQAIIEPPTDPILEKAVLIRNQTVCSTDIISYGNNLFGVNMTMYPYFVGSNTNQVYLGVFFMGTILPLSSMDLRSPYQVPDQAILSYNVSTTVFSVAVDGLVPHVTEASPLNVTARVLDKDGNGIPEKFVYMFVRTSFRNKAHIGNAASVQIGAELNPKTTIFNVQMTNSATKIADFSQTQFSAKGAVGYYDVFVVCDGVFATWNGLDYFTVFVNTSIHLPEVLISWTMRNCLNGNCSMAAGYVESATIGEYWTNLPFAAVNVPGKYVIIQAQNMTQCRVITTSEVSGDDGVTIITTAIVTFVDGGPQDVHFDIIVDGLVLYSFKRQMNFPGYVAGGNYSQQCSSVRILSFPEYAFSDMQTLGLVQSVASDGTPVVSNISVIISAEFLPPPTGMNETVFTVVSGTHGTANIPVNLPNISAPEGAYINIYCNQLSTSKNAYSNYFRPRVKRLNVAQISPTSVLVSIVPYHWEDITEQNPLPINLQPNWCPSYFSNWNNLLGIVGFGSTIVISGNTTNEQLITFSNRSTFAGVFSLIFSVNGGYFGPQFFTTVSCEITEMNVVRSSLLETIVVGTYLNGAIVQLLGDNATPVVNVSLYLEFTHMQDGIEMVQSIFQNQTEIITGGFVRYAKNVSAFGLNDTTFASEVYSDPSDANGLAHFEQVMCIGMLPNLNISFRYCVASFVPMDMSNLTNLSDFCVHDPYHAFTTLNQSITFTVSATSVSGTPGQYLPDIVVVGAYHGGKPADVVFCAPFLKNASRNNLIFRPMVAVPLGTFYQIGVGPALTLRNSIQLEPLMIEGSYLLYFVCQGEQTEPIPLIVSSAVSAVQTVLQPPSTISVSQIVSAVVTALAYSSKPVVDAPIALEIISKDPACLNYSKSPGQCGQLFPGSQTLSLTGSDGRASFAFAFLSGVGPFTVTMSVKSLKSPISVQQIANAAFSSVTENLGLSFAASSAFVAVIQHSVLPLLAIVKKIATNAVDDSAANTAQRQLADLLGIVPVPPAEATFDLTITNPVHSVVIVSQPNIVLQLDPLSSVTGQSEETVIVSCVHCPDPAVPCGSCPTVMFLDMYGSPVSGVKALVEVFPARNKFHVEYSAPTPGPLVSDANGMLQVCPLKFTFSVANEYVLFISSMGGGGIATAPIKVTQQLHFNRTTIMKYLSVLLLLFFSPMLFSSVPFSRFGYQVVGIVFTIVLLGLGIYARNDIPDNPLYLGYYTFLLAGLGTIAVFATAVAVVDGLAYRVAVPWYSMRFMNDERKATKIYQYAMWIINIRRSQQRTSCMQQHAEEELQRAAATHSSAVSLVGDAGNFLLAVKDKIDAKLSRKRERQRLQQGAASKIYYNRPDLEVTSVPFGFYIVATFTLVLLITMGFLIIYLFHIINVYANTFLSFLPGVGDSGRIEQANNVIVKGISAGLSMAVATFPEIGSLSNLIPRIQNINLVMALSTIRDNMSLALLGIKILFITAGCISVAAVIIALVRTYRQIPVLIRCVRRGDFYCTNVELAPVEGYIGLHVMTLLMLQQLTFWFIVLVSFILAMPFTRAFISSNFLVLGLAFGLTFISQKFLEQVVIKRFLAKGGLLVVRPELYALWHFGGLILGLFTGIVAIIVRWCSAVCLLTFTFASVEMSIFTSDFCSLDKVHFGFICSIVVEARTNNPIMQLFATLLLTKRELRRLATAGARSTDHTVQVDSIFQDDTTISSGIKNLSRVYARTLASKDNCTCLLVEPVQPTLDIEFLIDDVSWKRREKVRQRFWLWWLMIRTPSLCEERKHNIVYVNPNCEFDHFTSGQSKVAQEMAVE